VDKTEKAAKSTKTLQPTNPSTQQQTQTHHQDLELAVKYHNAGDYLKARGIYQQILETEPNQFDALHLLGVMAHQRGENNIALNLIMKALAIKPDYAEAHSNLGAVFRELGQLNDAVMSYQKALAIKPDYAEAYNNLGNAFKQLAQFDEAVASYQEAVEINPGYAEAHSNLGLVYRDLGKLGEAVDSYRKALAIKPDYAEVHNNFGNLLRELGRLDEAVVNYQKALTIKPDYAEVHNNLGNAFKELGQLDEAVARYHNALDVKPDYAEAYSNLGNTFLGLGKLDNAVASYRKALSIKPYFPEAEKNLLSARLYLPEFSPGELVAENLYFPEKLVQETHQFAENLANTPTPDRQLRVGYLSSDFWDHPVGRNVLPLLSSHDRANFEVHCYSDVRRPDAVTGRFRTCAYQWHTIVGKSDAEVAEMVRVGGIDVLVCLAGRFDNNRPLVCTYRAAPVQVSYHDGATTSFQALWMGVPVVSLAGETFNSRIGGSILHHLGLRELVVNTPEAYVDCVGDLAGDLSRLRTLRMSLRARITSSLLCDASAYARNVEAAYRGMWRAWCKKHEKFLNMK